MSQRTSTQRRSWKERALSLLLAAALMTGLVPGLTLPASAEHWADAYLDQLVDWGVMRADQTANPDAALTRAEFFAVINRAYGYTETGYIPFEDVLETDWFYDDISIAYTAGYMAGTSDTTASPNDPLTREQAFCILGRNMMLKDAPGESLAFSDSRDVSDWARGTIKAAADNYIISGYPDNTLHPQDSISKGQMAVLVSQCLGTPIQESGTYDLGGVFGNVTITAPNVTLRNATISGDLYISGGVGLGGIKLENVDVLGRIIVSGTGESEGGDASVIMRNVTADEMLVDNMRNKTVTIRADGITNIANTTVRTNAYLEDNNTDEEGLLHIEVDGNPGLRLTLAGRIKEVVNKTPSSYIQAAKGTVAKLTVDEAATNSTVQIDRNTKINEVNLDVATSVLGDGDIGQLNVNAPGSVVTMLPDKIYVRPGLTASIAGVIMDYQAAEEGSLDPRLLSGYPAAKDIAPTGFRADFAGNKKGTVYWAVSYVSDGSIGEDDLISPPSYGSKAVANGSVAEPAGGDEVSAQVGNLVVGGSYYLSAILVDEQKERSPVKVISFSTPDNTVPAFGQGYPYMSRTTRDVAQVTVMPTKSCKLYYALLPQGAQAPTPNELKAAAVAGNLGYGVRDVTKNTEDVFTVNRQRLEELKTYVLYLWLTDVDGVNSSAVTSLSFTIPDETPPEFVVHPYVNGNPQATSIPMAATVNENATIFWAVVEEGAAYPLPNNNSEPLSKDNEIVDGQVVSSKLTSDYAKLCVTSGMGALQRGQVVAQANTEVTFNVTGLLAEKAYDFYYVARDTAGNYSVQVYKLQGGLHTLDTSGPAIIQSFSAVPSPDDPNNPLSSTDIFLEFSENIHSIDASVSNKDFLALYSAKDKTEEDLDMFIRTLKASIVLYHIDPNTTEASEVKTKQDVPSPSDWVIDYSKVTIRAVEDGRIRITFPGIKSSPDSPAVRLANGEQYFFQFRNLTDTSTANNPVSQYNNDSFDYRVNRDTKHNIPAFTTVFSQVLLNSQGIDDAPIWGGAPGTESGRNPSEVANGAAKIHAMADANFRLNPQSTKNTDESNRYDILIYSDTTISFDLYYRITKKDGTPITDPIAEGYGKSLLVEDDDVRKPDEKGWFYLGNQSVNRNNGKSVGASFTGRQNTTTGTAGFPKLQNLDETLFYEFVISVTKNGIQTDRKDWSGEVYFDIYVEAGRNDSLWYLGNDPSQREYCEGRGLGRTNGVVNIGLDQIEGTKYLHVPAPFRNTQPPTFRQNTPWFSSDESGGTNPKYAVSSEAYPPSIVGDSFAYMFVNLNAQGTIHYVISPRTSGIIPELATPVAGDVWDQIPTDGSRATDPEPPEVTWPSVLEVAEHDSYFDARLYPQQGSVPYTSSGMIPISVSGLTADTDYYIYFVLEAKTDNDAAGERSRVYTYKFRTAKTTKPRITLDDTRQGTVTIKTFYSADSTLNVSADLHWIVLLQGEGESQLTGTGNSFNVKEADSNITGYSDVTDLLKALSTEYNASTAYGSGADLENVKYGPEYNGLTVFDVLASDAQRQKVEDLARRLPAGLGKVKEGDVQTRPTDFSAGAYWADGNNVQPAPDAYLILVVGHNIGSRAGDNGEWSIDSFRAYNGVVLQDLTAPALRTVGGNINFVGNDTSKVSGTITLSFTKAVYWRNGGTGTFYKVLGNLTPNNQGPTGEGDSATVGLLHNLSGSTEGLTTNGGPQDFTINFTNISSGAYYELLTNGNIAAYQGNSRSERIIIRFGREPVTEQTAEGGTRTGWRPYFTVEFGTEEGGTISGVNPVWSDSAGSALASVPKLESTTPTISGSPADGSYKLTIPIAFNQEIYQLSGSKTTAVSNILTDSKYTQSGDTSKVTASTSNSTNHKTFTLTLTLKPNFGSTTFTLLPNSTISDKTGKASTTDKLTVTVSEVKSGTGLAPVVRTKVEIKFGDKTIERTF